METLVVSAFPACGKTYACEHNDGHYSMLDSDSSKFSWNYDENGNKTDIRNPDFPNNYIQHIKENLGKVDIIFVSSHLSVRDAMSEAGIGYVTVYPRFNMINEWVGRMYRRGSDKRLIDFIIKEWDNMVNRIIYENHGGGIWILGNNEYIDIRALMNWGVGMNYGRFY